MTQPKARFFERKDNKIHCLLCPNSCWISPDSSGICQVRQNEGESLQLPFYGRASALAIDPIEKKPLYHFHPGRSILSIGFVGCSLRCPFCQNYRISQSTDVPTDLFAPEELIDLALERDSFGMAYTYNEPSIHFEYVSESAEAAYSQGLKNVLVSNGYLNRQPAEELLSLIDAANIDLKSFNPDFYRKELGGKLEPVLDFIEIASRECHLEITTLIIPGKNDSKREMREISRFIASLNPEIPLHLSAYRPTYNYSIPPTPRKLIEELAKVASEELSFVFKGNMPGESNTICPYCGSMLIRRSGYRVDIEGIRDSVCQRCGEQIAIIGT